jgi:HEAT repeat protein
MPLFGLFGRPNIGELKAKGDVEELINALNFPNDDNVRFEAASALGDIGDSRCVEPLMGSLNDTHHKKEVAIRSLGKIGDPQALPTLIDALQDENWEIRSMAARSLGQIGDSSATEALINAMQNDTEAVRWYIIQALTNITGQSFEHNINEWEEWLQQKQTKGIENE